MATATSLLRRSRTTEHLVSAYLVVSADVTESASNYWTVTLRKRSSGQSYGTLVGSFSTAEKLMTAGTQYLIYSSTPGLLFAAGDSLWATAASTGTIIDLVQPKVEVTFQKAVR